MSDERKGFFDDMSNDVKGWVWFWGSVTVVASVFFICVCVYWCMKIVYLPETFAEPQVPHTAKATIKFEQ